MTCSKRILVVSYVFGILLSVITVAGSFLGCDVSAVVTLAGIAWGEISVSNAFYYNKAKRENAIKIAVSMVKDQKISDAGKELLSNLIGVINN